MPMRTPRKRKDRVSTKPGKTELDVLKEKLALKTAEMDRINQDTGYLELVSVTVCLIAGFMLGSCCVLLYQTPIL